MQNGSARGAVLICALLCGSAGAQVPKDAADAARESLAALRQAPAAAATVAEVTAQRSTQARALVAAIDAGKLPADALRKLDVGVAAILLGDDAVCRDALIVAATGRRVTTLRWWAPLHTLALDPACDAGLVAPVTRCLGAAAWPKLVTELVHAFEDAAAAPASRVRAVTAAGVLAQTDLPTWGPVGPLVRALSDGVEPVRLAAERELERLLLLEESTTAVELRRWWEEAQTRTPSEHWRRREQQTLRRRRQEQERYRSEYLAQLPNLNVTGLIKALTSTFVEVRREAAKQLQKRPDEPRAALAPLSDRLTNEPNAEVREAIIGAIGARLQAGDTDVLQRLAGRAVEGTERHPRVRRAAIQALASTPIPSSANVVITALLTDIAPVVREAAAEALTKFGGHAGLVNAVRKALRPGDEKTVAVRVAVARALGKLGADPIGDADACAPLAEAAQSDPDEKVRWQAVFALGSVVCAGDDAVLALLHAARKGEAASVRKLAVSQLGKRKNPAKFKDISKALVEALADKDDADVRRAAAEGLERLGGNDAYLLWNFAKLADAQGELRGAAILAEAALKVLANGSNEKPLSEADAALVRRWLVDLWERAGEPGLAIPHAKRDYDLQPTTNGARKFAELCVQAGKYEDGLVALREASVRFKDQAEALQERGVELLYEAAVNGEAQVEVATAEALAELGAVPAGVQWMADAIDGGADVARALTQAAGGDAAARTALHDEIAVASGFKLEGMVQACLRRLKAAQAVGLEADAALRAIGATRCPPPASDPPAKDWTAEARQGHRAAWANAWRQVRPALIDESEKTQPPKKTPPPKDPDKEKKPK